MYIFSADNHAKPGKLIFALSLVVLAACTFVERAAAANMVRIPSDISKLGPSIEYSARYSDIDAAAMAYVSHMVFYASYRSNINSERDLRIAYLESLRAAGFQLVNTRGPDGPLIADTANETDYFVFGTNKATFLVFRGTENPERGLSNIVDTLITANSILAQRQGVRGLIHPGYHDAYNRAHPSVRRSLRQFDRSKPIYITGHSLGGALATVAAYKLQKEGFNIRAVYPLASPRVGDRTFTHDYERLLGNKTFRIKRRGDHVSEIPYYGPIGILFKYEHVGPYRSISQIGSSSRHMVSLNTGRHDDGKNFFIIANGLVHRENTVDRLFRRHHSRDHYFLPLWNFAKSKIDRAYASAQARARAAARANIVKTAPVKNLTILPTRNPTKK